MQLSLVARDAGAGILGAVIVLPTILNCGSVLAQPLGAHFVAAGTAAALAASIVVSLLRGLAAGEPLHLVSPKATYAAMVSALLVTAMARPGFAQAFPDPDRQAAMIMALGFLCGLLAGLFQTVLGVTRLGKFIKFIPYPVIAGFINGFAILLLLGQLPAMLGERNWGALREVASGGAAPHAGAALLGITACALTLVIPVVMKRGPTALVAVVAGTGLYWGAVTLFPAGEWGRAIGALPAGLPLHPQFGAVAELARSAVFHELAPDLIATAVMLAMIASLQSLLSISTADAVLGTRHDSNRELILQGAGNLLSGMVGGMPTGGSPSVTRTVLENGGRGRTANLAHGLALAAIALGLGGIIGLIPTTVMAGVVVASTFSQMDGWSRTLLKQLAAQRGRRNGDLLATFALVASVTAIVVTVGVLSALVTGMTLAFVMFIRQASQSIVRRTISGARLRSRTSRPSLQQAALGGLTERLVLVQVQGAIFFGSVEQLADHLERVAAGRELVILDLRRVGEIDGSGAVALDRMDKALQRNGCTLLLAYVPEQSPMRQSLAHLGCARILRDERVFTDNDGALAYAEDLLLERAGFRLDDSVECPLAEFDILKGLSGDEIAAVAALLVREELPAGTAIVREGDAGDSFYLLAVGRVTVSREIAGRALRFSSFGPGISFGEIGMLTGRPRVTDVVAETATVCWRLDGERFRALCREQPALCRQILINISIGLSDIVASLSEMVRELEQ